MIISVGRCLKSEVVKEYINKSFATSKVFVTYQSFIPHSKKKHRNVNIWFSKFCALRPKWYVLAGSKMTHSVYVCSAYQNVLLLIDAMDWVLTYKDLIKSTLSYLTISTKTYLEPLLYHHHSQEYFF